MKNLKPVFLFAFANDKGRSLQLSEEERSLREILAPAHDQGRIEVVQLGHATLDGIYKAFNRFHNRIALFHYSGHSDAQFLNLEDRNARSAALSILIGQQKNLQLVFLNGCANKEQVKVLFEKNVQTIIATATVVEDPQALQFSKQFYEAIAHEKSIQEAFETAKSILQNDETSHEIGQFEYATFEEEEATDFPWGLYTKASETLTWTLPSPSPIRENPDYTNEVTLNLPEVNKCLVLETFAGMAANNPGFAPLLQLYQSTPTSTFFNTLQNTILDTFPSMLSVQIRDLFTPEGKTLGRVRLRELNEVYTTLARLLCAISMANLWDESSHPDSGGEFTLRSFYLEDIEKYIKWSSSRGMTEDHFWMLRTICAVFKENDRAFYVNELADLNEEFNNASEVYAAYRFLEQELNQRLIAQNILIEEVESLCEAAEQHLGVLLKACTFLTNYQLIAIKQISVDLPRKETEPIFVHQKAILKGRDYATIDMEPIRRANTSSNNAVFITKNIEEEGLPLNLSPFLIDQNAFKIKKQYLPKVYFFDGINEEELHFSHADTIDLDFVVSKAASDPLYRNLDHLFVGFNHFREDLGV